MAQKITMEYLANKLSYSKTTVSKALNNCPGIDSQTKERIRTVAAEVGYIFPCHPRDVAAILPSAPNYFWGQMRKQLILLGDTQQITSQHYIYQNLADTGQALQCLETALASGPSALICALPDTKAIRTRLTEAAGQIFVLMIEELLPVTNAFFIGGDPYRNGKQLAQAYLKAYPTRRHFGILQITASNTEQRRTEGFIQAVTDSGGGNFIHISPPPSSKTAAAYYARALSAATALPDCVFCPSGGMESARLAAKKLKSEITVIGFDDRKDGTLSLRQDASLLAKEAIMLSRRFLETARFPEKKYTFVDPQL